MQLTGRPPSGVALDCDLGARPGTPLAVEILFALDQKSECRVISMATTRSHLHSAAYLDAVYRFYSGTGPFVRPLPVGMALKGPADPLPHLEKALQRHNHEIQRLADTADPYAVLRNAFTTQFDGNGLAILCGPATNFAKVLDLPGSRELIALKCKLMVAAIDDTRRAADPAAAERLMAEWPSPLVICEWEGRLPAAAVAADHPSGLAEPADAELPGRDAAAILAAVRPNEPYFRYSGEGRRRTVTIDPAQQDRAIMAMVELANAKPQPRTAPPKRPV